jgi:predicted DNA-binding transcriptional regulator AlpA
MSDTAVVERLLSKPEVLERVNRTFPTIWKWMREGTFPRARQVANSQEPVWLESEVNEWIRALPVKSYKGDE